MTRFRPQVPTTGAAKLRVLSVHNYYRQAGGEDEVFRTEVELLRSHGHSVDTFVVHNANASGFTAARALFRDGASARELANQIDRHNPDLIHLYNTFPLLATDAYTVLAKSGIAAVQTVQNYRYACANGMMFRNDMPCEACLGKVVPWPSVQHGCYRESRLASALVATKIAKNRIRRTWPSSVEVFIVPTEFAKRVLVRGGLPEERIEVMANFSWRKATLGQRREGIIFAGRLSAEKGIGTLLQAVEQSDRLNLTIAGDGPLRGVVEEAAKRCSRISYLGWVKPAEVEMLMARHLAVAVPSMWYEGYPMVIVSAFAAGTPVVASNIGGLSSIVEHGVTGYLVHPGVVSEWSSALTSILQNTEETLACGSRAATHFDRFMSPESHYNRLLQIYSNAMQQRA